MRKSHIIGLLSAVALSSIVQAKTLVFCSEGSPEGFDPALYTAGTTFDASSRPVFNRLVEVERGTTNLIPGLATKWESSADGKTITFTLRKGVKFHANDYFKPTRDFNADDVVWNFERQWKKDHAWFSYVTGGQYEYFIDNGFPDFLDAVEKVDDYTVRLKLKTKQATLIAILSTDFASMQSKEYADKLQKDGKMAMLNTNPIGTGAFQFVGYQQDAVIRYKANPNYWEGKPAIDDLVYAITKDAAVRLQKLKANECQVAFGVNPADLDQVKNDANLKLLSAEGFNVGYVAYNTTLKPFDDVRVRKALNMAINKNAILDAVYNGTGKVAKNPIPPSLWSYNNKIEDDKYDPAAAKKLLADAGVKDLKMKLWYMPVARPYNPSGKRMGELIQADWKAVGVDAELSTLEWAEYLKKSKDVKRDSAVMLGWTGDYADPANFMQVLLACDAVGSNNRAQWCNKEYDDLVVKATETFDVKQRTTLYEKAQEIFKREAPWATIAHSVVFKPMRKEVDGFKISPFGGHDFAKVDIK